MIMIYVRHLHDCLVPGFLSANKIIRRKNTRHESQLIALYLTPSAGFPQTVH